MPDAAGSQCLTNSPVQVAVNVSGTQFTRRNFVEEVVATLEKTGLPPSLLQLKLTDSVMLTDTDRAIQTFVGISLAIDDFWHCLFVIELPPAASF